MRKIYILIFAVLFLISSAVNAALTMTVDTANETISFSGSEAGTFTSPTWGGFGTSPEDLFVTAGITGTFPSVQLRVSTDDIRITIFSFSSPVTGNGTTVSYAGQFSALNQTYLESLNGSNMTSNNGFNDITITVVPEPSQYAALFGAGLLGLGFLRRRSVGCSAIR